MRIAKEPAFPARWDKTSGHIIIEGAHDNLPTPQITFVPLSGGNVKFIKPIDDIVEIKKVFFFIFIVLVFSYLRAYGECRWAYADDRLTYQWRVWVLPGSLVQMSKD